MKKTKISKVGNTTTMRYINGTVVKISVAKSQNLSDQDYFDWLIRFANKNHWGFIRGASKQELADWVAAETAFGGGMDSLCRFGPTHKKDMKETPRLYYNHYFHYFKSHFKNYNEFEALVKPTIKKLTKRRVAECRKSPEYAEYVAIMNTQRATR
jgi:hypothetical protein